jgi:hypothetical protein
MENHNTAFTKQSIFLMSLFFLGELTYIVIFTMMFYISSYLHQMFICNVNFCWSLLAPYLPIVLCSCSCFLAKYFKNVGFLCTKL